MSSNLDQLVLAEVLIVCTIGLATSESPFTFCVQFVKKVLSLFTLVYT